MALQFRKSMCFVTFHSTAITAKVQSRNKILKSLAGSSWGKYKDTAPTYKVIGRPFLNYAASIWSPGCSVTQTNKLQICQSTALRIITGCLLMSPDENLHSQAGMLRVKEHNELLSKLGCFCRKNPCSRLFVRNRFTVEPSTPSPNPFQRIACLESNHHTTKCRRRARVATRI